LLARVNLTVSLLVNGEIKKSEELRALTFGPGSSPSVRVTLAVVDDGDDDEDEE
jgi:hypothetical protein